MKAVTVYIGLENANWERITEGSETLFAFSKGSKAPIHFASKEFWAIQSLFLGSPGSFSSLTRGLSTSGSPEVRHSISFSISSGRNVSATAERLSVSCRFQGLRGLLRVFKGKVKKRTLQNVGCA